MRTCRMRRFVLLRTSDGALPSMVLSPSRRWIRLLLYAPDGTKVSLSLLRSIFPIMKLNRKL